MDRPLPSLRWIRPPLQARTRRSLVRFLDAAEALTAEKGFDDASIGEIARRAGSSVGAFYRRFPDKDGLLQALHERFCEEARATADDALDPARWEGAPLARILGAVVTFLVQITRERAGLVRAIALREAGDPAIRERAQRLQRYVREGLARLVRQRSDEIDHPDPERGIHFVYGVALAALDRRALLGEGPSAAFDEPDPELACELTRVFLGYLGVRPGRPPTPGRPRASEEKP